MNKRVHQGLVLVSVMTLCVASAIHGTRLARDQAANATVDRAELAPMVTELPVVIMPAIVVRPTREERIAAFAVENPGSESELEMPFFSFGGTAGLE